MEDFRTKYVQTLHRQELEALQHQIVAHTPDDPAVQQLQHVINALAHIQATDFPKSIEVITGRIPGQGKQSYTSATIVGFVSSSQNASYAPVEQNMVTGQDHDIDKTNIMAFSVNAIGQLYDYKPYLKYSGKGDPSKEKFDIKNYKIDYPKYHTLLNAAIEEFLVGMLKL